MVFISDTGISGGIDSPKKQKKKEEKTTLVVKRRSMNILEVNIRKKVSCVVNIFLNVFNSRPVSDYRISTSVFLVSKVHFSQSQAFNFLGKHAHHRKGHKILGHEAARIYGTKFVRPIITYTIPPSLK